MKLKQKTTMLHRFQPSPFLKDVFLTAITSALTVGSLVFSLRLIAQGLGSSEFGAYCLARQILSASIPFSTVGMSVALARCVAMAGSDRQRHDLLVSALLIVTAVMLALYGVTVTLKARITLLAFRESSYEPLLIGTVCLLGAYTYYSVLYGFHRGSNEMGRANLWQIITMSLIPVGVAVVCSHYGKAELIVLPMAALSGVVVAPLVLSLFKNTGGPKEDRSLGWAARQLVSYGLPRVPGGLAYGGILSVGPFLAPYFGSMKEAGYLVVGQSLFRIAEGAIEAFGIVALPRVAALVAEERHGFLRQRVNDIVIMILHLGLFMTPRLFLWSDWIITVWIGSDYAEGVPLVRLLSLGLIPYLAFAMLRSFIDGIQRKAVTTFHSFISLSCTVVFSILLAKSGLGAKGLAIGTVLGVVCLGGLTVRYLVKIGMLEIKGIIIKEVLVMNTALFLISVLLKHLLGARLESPVFLILALLGEGVLLSLYVGVLWRRQVSWLTELRNRLVRGAEG